MEENPYQSPEKDKPIEPRRDGIVLLWISCAIIAAMFATFVWAVIS